MLDSIYLQWSVFKTHVKWFFFALGFSLFIQTTSYPSLHIHLPPSLHSPPDSQHSPHPSRISRNRHSAEPIAKQIVGPNSPSSKSPPPHTNPLVSLFLAETQIHSTELECFASGLECLVKRWKLFVWHVGKCAHFAKTQIRVPCLDADDPSTMPWWWWSGSCDLLLIIIPRTRMNVLDSTKMGF